MKKVKKMFYCMTTLQILYNAIYVLGHTIVFRVKHIARGAYTVNDYYSMALSDSLVIIVSGYTMYVVTYWSLRAFAHDCVV